MVGQLQSRTKQKQQNNSRSRATPKQLLMGGGATPKSDVRETAAWNLYAEWARQREREREGAALPAQVEEEEAALVHHHSPHQPQSQQASCA